MLPEGLRLRTAGRQDAEALATFNATVHEGERYGEWTRDLVADGHPTVEPDDVFVVTTRDGAIVSSLLLIPQRWTYGGQEIEVGQVEFVGTAREYRRKGLVRALMNAVHERATQRGLAVQAISGIPSFYLQFGYAYALDLWVGRQSWRPQLATLPKITGWSVRPATQEDVPAIAAIASRAGNRYLVTHPREERLWRYELTGRREGSDARQAVEVLESSGGDLVGVVVRSRGVYEGRVGLVCCEIAPDAAWLDAGPAVLRHCQDVAAELDERFLGVMAGLGRSHPLYEACATTLTDAFDWASWFIRVPDLTGFVRSVLPVLNRRLAASVAANWSGDVRVNAYTYGLRLVLERGTIVAVERTEDVEGAGAALPPDQLLQLVFGFRDLDRLVQERYDCSVDDARTRAVLRACFPSGPSNVWPLG